MIAEGEEFAAIRHVPDFDRHLLPAEMSRSPSGLKLERLDVSNMAIESRNRFCVRDVMEMEIVHEVVTASAKKFKAVIGLEPTLKALNANRVWQFVYSSAYSAPGFECAQCGALFSTKTKACPHCRGSVVAVADVVERAVGHAVRSNVSVEVVTEDAGSNTQLSQ